LSVQAKIMNLLSGITDPTVRVDIASTVNYLFSVYSGGHANEDEIRDCLYEVCLDVISVTHPELIEEEVRKKSRTLVEEFIRAFRLESTRRRMLSRFRGRVGLPI